jgi:hypothetical protein
MTEPNDLDRVGADIVVDAYGDDEQDTAFLTVFEEECELPTTATLLGTPVTVTGLTLPHAAWSRSAKGRRAPER